jgi:hypothetical protein
MINGTRLGRVWEWWVYVVFIEGVIHDIKARGKRALWDFCTVILFSSNATQPCLILFCVPPSVQRSIICRNRKRQSESDPNRSRPRQSSCLCDIALFGPSLNAGPNAVEGYPWKGRNALM